MGHPSCDFLRISGETYKIPLDNRAWIVRQGLHLRDEKYHIYLRPVMRPRGEGGRPAFEAGLRTPITTVVFPAVSEKPRR
jgi:hypothetical protein